MITSDLYIVILNYNSATETVNLFESLQNQGMTLNQIIVVDNNSNPQDKTILTTHLPLNQLRLLTDNKGYALGNQVGIEEAIKKKIPYVLLLNPDIRLEEFCIEKLLKAIKENKDLAAIGPRICYRDDKDVIYSDGGIIYMDQGCFTTHRHYNESVHNVPASDELIDVDYVNGSVLMINTNFLIDIGFMRSDFFLYFEETEWCLRAKAKGYKLATLTTALAYHKTSDKGKKYHYYMTRNRIFLSRLYPEYYGVTKRALLEIIKNEIKNQIKEGLFPSPVLRAKIKGFIVGNFKKLK